MRKGAGVWHPTVDDSLPNGSRPPKACVQKRRCTWKNVRTCGCDEDRLVTGGTSPKRFTTNRLTTLKQEIWIYVSCIKINYLLLLNQFAWICMHTLYIYICVFFFTTLHLLKLKSRKRKTLLHLELSGKASLSCQCKSHQRHSERPNSFPPQPNWGRAGKKTSSSHLSNWGTVPDR